MIALRTAWRDFKAGGKPILQLEATATEAGQPAAWAAQPDPHTQWPAFALAGAGATASETLFLLTGADNPSIALLGLALLLFLPPIMLLDWHQTEYALLGHQLVAKTGTFSRQPQQASLADIETWAVHQTRWQRRYSIIDLCPLRTAPNSGTAPRAPLQEILRLRGITIHQASILLQLAADLRQQQRPSGE